MSWTFGGIVLQTLDALAQADAGSGDKTNGVLDPSLLKFSVVQNCSANISFSDTGLPARWKCIFDDKSRNSNLIRY